MKYTEWRGGKLVLRDEGLLSGAIAKLARLEGLETVQEVVCDKYCKYPCISESKEEMDSFCAQCELLGLLQALLQV